MATATNSVRARTLRPQYIKSLKTIKDSDRCVKTVWELFSLWRLCIALFTDIATHIYGFVSGDGDFLEGSLTIGLHLISCILCFFVAKYSSTRHPVWNTLLLVLGLYGVEWKLTKRENDRTNRRILKEFLLDVTPTTRPRRSGDWPDNVERIAAVNLHANNMVDVNLAFISTMVCALPMAGLKIYFGFIAEERVCSFTAITRLPFIIFGLWEMVSMAKKYDVISIRYLSAHSWKYFMDTNFTNEPDIEEFNFINLVSTLCFHTIFILYRVRMIVFNFTLGILIGLFHLIGLALVSACHHYISRPFYENPPIGVPTFTSNIIEIWTKVFTFLGTPFKRVWIHTEKRVLTQLTHRFLCFAFIWATHFIGIMFHIVYNSLIAPSVVKESSIESPISTCTPSCLKFVLTQLEKLHMVQHPVYTEYSFGFFFNTIEFYLFIALNVIYVIHFLIIRFTDLTHRQFPAHTAMNIWGKKFMNKNSKYWIQHSAKSYDPNHVDLKKLLVLTTLWPSEFGKQMKKGKEYIKWHVLFAKQSRSSFANTNDSVVREMLNGLSQNPQKIPSTVQRKLMDLLNFAVENGDDAELTKLTFNFCSNFVERMEYMTSIRISQTCNILGVSPVVTPDERD